MLLYIHIPFCDSKCSYCAFNSYVDKFHLKFDYMQALFIQLKYELERFDTKHNSIETIFIGGGTPSTVAPELYKDIFEFLQPYLKADIEITSEANPNSATYEWLEGCMHLESTVSVLVCKVLMQQNSKCLTVRIRHKWQKMHS